MIYVKDRVMKITYRNQLPGKAPRETRFEGWLGTIIAILIGAGLLALLIFVIIPLALFGILTFIALILFGIIVGWVYLGLKIGWRNLWDFTKLFFGITFGRHTGQSRAERIRKAWEDRVKGKSGQWVR